MTTQAGTDRASSGTETRPSPGTGRIPHPGIGDSTTRYRYLIAVVTGLESTVTIDQLVDVMARWEAAHGGDEKSWHDVHEELYRVDLPTLDRAGFVEFDTHAGTITEVGAE